jgi:hypothetical protein
MTPALCSSVQLPRHSLVCPPVQVVCMGRSCRPNERQRDPESINSSYPPAYRIRITRRHVTKCSRITDQPCSHQPPATSSADTSSADTQDRSSILWNPKVYYCTHESPPLAPILSQTSPLRTAPLCLQDQSQYYPATYVLVCLLVSFLLAFPPVPHLRSSSPHSYYIPSHLVLLNLIILITLISLWSKYSPQHTVLKHPQFMFLSYCQRSSFIPIREDKRLGW